MNNPLNIAASRPLIYGNLGFYELEMHEWRERSALLAEVAEALILEENAEGTTDGSFNVLLGRRLRATAALRAHLEETNKDIMLCERCHEGNRKLYNMGTAKLCAYCKSVVTELAIELAEASSVPVDERTP